jgi:stage II sporulation protein Q
MKKKLVLKPFVEPVLYSVFIIAILVGAFFTVKLVDTKDNITYVSKTILDEYIPVVGGNNEEKIMKPYTGNNVTITTNYYDYQDESKQQGSIIYYENTYIQNPGINYTSDEAFDVVSILDGEVLEVKEDELLGKSITIKHNNNLISVYTSVDEIKVDKGSKVVSGEVIAKASTCNLLKDKYNLHFELYLNGEVVNPNNYLDNVLKED